MYNKIIFNGQLVVKKIKLIIFDPKKNKNAVIKSSGGDFNIVYV